MYTIDQGEIIKTSKEIIKYRDLHSTFFQFATSSIVPASNFSIDTIVFALVIIEIISESSCIAFEEMRRVCACEGMNKAYILISAFVVGVAGARGSGGNASAGE